MTGGDPSGLVRWRERPSPTRAARAVDVPIDTLVLHYTGMRSAEAALDRLCDAEARVSSHYVVEEDGTIWRLVPEELRAAHAGVSFWRGHAGLNERSVGIEIVNPGHEWGYRDFPALQLAATCDLCLSILSRHPIPARNVVAHSDIAPDRKEDPGERFDWGGFAANGVGMWAGRRPRSRHRRRAARRRRPARGAGSPRPDRLPGEPRRADRPGAGDDAARLPATLAARDGQRQGGRRHHRASAGDGAPGRLMPGGDGARAGAGEGNRTLVCSLGSCRSTIELHPRSTRL